MTLMSESVARTQRRNLKLHLDHVDARVLCTLYGKGTEWVGAPAGWLHAAASFADHGTGGAVGDVLREAVLRNATGGGGGRSTALPLRVAREREAVLVRGTSNAGVWRGQARLHRGPDVQDGEWRVLVKVDDGPGWWRDETLKFLHRPSKPRQHQTWGQRLVRWFGLARG